MNLEVTVLSEISQSEKNRVSDSTYRKVGIQRSQIQRQKEDGWEQLREFSV